MITRIFFTNQTLEELYEESNKNSKLPTLHPNNNNIDNDDDQKDLLSSNFVHLSPDSPNILDIYIAIDHHLYLLLVY